MRKVAVVGDGETCRDMIDLLLSEHLSQLGLSLVGVASRDISGVNSIRARERSIPVVNNPRALMDAEGLDTIVLTDGGPESYAEILSFIPPSVHVLDSYAAQIILEIFECEERRLQDCVRSTDSLKKMAEHYWTLFDNSVAALFRTGIEKGEVLMCNTKLANILGFEKREDVISGYNVAMNYVEPSRRKDLLDELEKNGKVDNFEFQQKRIDSTVFWAELSAKIFPKKGYLEGMLMDISARKKAEEENRFLTQRLLRVQEEERARIARDLHDELGQALSSLQFDMSSLKNALSAGLGDPLHICDRIIDHIASMGESVRNISYELRPDILDQLGLIPAMELYIESFKDRNKSMEVILQVMGFKKRLEPEVEIVLYRLMQEALNNIQKHSRADKIHIMVTFSYPEVILTIKDNGVGFPVKRYLDSPSQRGAGIGLLGMRERVDSVGGALEIRAKTGKGTIIRARIPVAKRKVG